MRKAIILNCQQSGLSVIQELGRNGVPCVAMDFHRSIGTYSKYGKYVEAPDPLSREKDAVSFLYDYCAREKNKPVVFPISDEWVTAVSKNKNMIDEVALPCVSGWETVQRVVEKENFYRMGQKNGFLTPYTWEFDELNSLNGNHFPIVAKPRYRRFSHNQEMRPLLRNMDRLRCCILHDKQELEDFVLRESMFLENLIFQEYVPGMTDCMYNVGIYANQRSEILGLFSGHKIRGYPAAYGNCVVGENYQVPDEVAALTERLVTDLEIQGIAEFEFKKDESQGVFRLIEINLRPWFWIGITPACGVSLPLIAYKDLCGETVQFAISSLPNGSVKFIRLLEDAKNSLISYRKTYPPWSKTYREWKQDIAAQEKVYAEFHAGDWMVGVKSIYDMLARMVHYGIRRLKAGIN